MSDTDDRVIQINIEALHPNPQQPRVTFKPEQLNEMVSSIVAHGILEPLVVAATPIGYQIIAGERRWRAAKQAGLATVPAIVRKTTPKGMLEMAIVENVQREDLNPLDRGKAFQRLMREFHISNNEIAKRIGKSPSYVSNSMRMLTLPDALKDGLLSGAITEGHARALSAIADTRAMIEAYKMVLKENATVRRAEDIARRFCEQVGTVERDRGVKRKPIIISPQIDKWQEMLQKTFSPKSKVRLIRSRAQTRLVLTFNGTPEETQEDLNKILKITI